MSNKHHITINKTLECVLTNSALENDFEKLGKILGVGNKLIYVFLSKQIAFQHNLNISLNFLLNK